jgi:ribosomal protein L31
VPHANSQVNNIQGMTGNINCDAGMTCASQSIAVTNPIVCNGCGTSDDTSVLQSAINSDISQGKCFQFNGNYTVTSILINGASHPCWTGKGGLVAKAGSNVNALLEIKDTIGLTMDGNLTINCASNGGTAAGIKLWTDNAAGTLYNTIHSAAFVNCRVGVQIGDPSIANFTNDSTLLWDGYFYNTAQPFVIYGAETGVNIRDMTVQANNTNWVSSFNVSGSGTNLTVNSISSGYLAAGDVISGTGIPAGTIIVSPTSGTLGGAGVYVTSVPTISAGSASGQTPAWNYAIYGSTVHLQSGYAINNINSGVAGVGKLFQMRPIASAPEGNPYARVDVQGTIFEGYSIIANSDTNGVSSPGSGSLYITNVAGDFTGNASRYIELDSLC